ncbi:HAD family hydrolase [Streptomyces sp. VRA16 Mangrove soil]|uniref:HAD family hydrolase n=1 Tax=Streptomyces sp. VRA16 Mangrove soil TaxID=2817434 RepID=UPI0027DDE824|nr:HAD family hydrolase [Streptomyces sp. VRA16 Mangrove soil]
MARDEVAPDGSGQGAAAADGTDEARPSGGLAALIARTRQVLFDFDGPICRLFQGVPAEDVAKDLAQWLDDRGLHDVLAGDARAAVDPQAALRCLHRSRRGDPLVQDMERFLSGRELLAARTARPTDGSDRLIRAWRRSGARLAVTTNNSPEAVRRYLAGRGLSACFGPHIYGRTHDPDLLKPDPDTLRRALRAMGGSPGATLMVGDGPSDLEAARAAGVMFLGYARNERKAQLLHQAEAPFVVTALGEVLDILRVVSPP